MVEKAYGLFSPVLGIKEDIPSILLSEGFSPTELPDTKDIFFNNGEIHSVKKRLKAWDAQLTDFILHVKQAQKRDGTVYEVLCTKRDIAYRDSANDRINYLTQQYAVGKIRVENGSAKVYGGLEVDNCDDAVVQWVDGSGGDVTPSRETTSPKDGTAFVRLTVAGTAGVEDLAYHDIASTDLTAYDSVGMWVRSSVNTNAGDLQFVLAKGAGLTTVTESIDIPALTANTWAWVNLTLADPTDLGAIVSIGITQIVDIGACTIDVDQIVAGDWAGQLKANDFITIGTTYSTDDTWYIISSVDSDTEITLTAVYAGSSASQQAYLARITYVGTTTDYWRSIVYNNKWIGTNNAKDNIQVWDLDTANQASDLGGSPPKCKYIGDFENYVIIADITDGAGDRYPQKYQWPSIGDETAWSTGDAGESTIPGADFIKGIGPGELDGFKLIATERALYRLHLVSGDEVFHREVITRDIGVAAPDSMVNQNRSIYAWCSDATFRRITTTSWEIVSKKIDPITRTISAQYAENIQGIYNDEWKQILWLIPNSLSSGRLNQILTLDLDDNEAWGTIDIEGSCFGVIKSASSITWDTLSFSTWDTWSWDEWDRLVNLANFLSTMVPDYNGDAFYLFQSEQDNSEDYERSFVLSTDLQQQRGINTFKRLLKAEAFFRTESSGTVAMQIKRDLEETWQNPQSATPVTLVKTGYDMVVTEFYFDYLARHFLLKYKASNKFRFLGVVLYFDPGYWRRF